MGGSGMQRAKMIAVALGMFCLIPHSGFSTMITWQNTGSDWGTAANWSPANIPNVHPEWAYLPPSSSPVSPNLANDGFTIESLVIDNSLGNYNITQSGTRELIFDSFATNGILVGSGTTTIHPNIRLGANAARPTYHIVVTNSAVLNFNGNVKLAADNAGGPRTAIVAGNGTIHFNTVLQVGTGNTQNHAIILSNFTGTVRVTGSNNIAGHVQIRSGTFLMNGVQTPPTGTNIQYYTVFTGTLGGVGTISATGTNATSGNPDGVRLRNDGGVFTTSNPVLNPGDPTIAGGIGKLTINGNLTLENQSASPLNNPTVAFTLASATSHDQIVVTNGLVRLNRNNAVTGRAILSLNILPTFTGGYVGLFLPLIENDGSDPIEGLFSTAGTAATVITNGHTFTFVNTYGETYGFRYLYNGPSGTGNDFGLEIILLQHVPEPTTVMLLALGGWICWMNRRRPTESHRVS